MNQDPSLAYAPFLPAATRAQRLPDGGCVLESGHDLIATSTTVFGWLRDWAVKQPDAVFLAERDGAGWRQITYSEMLALTERVALRLLGAGCGPDRPLATLGRNSIDHAAVILAAMRAGIPAAPISPSYASKTTDYTRLTAVLGSLPPALIYLAQPELFAPALAALTELGIPLFSVERAGPLISGLADLPAVDAAQLASAEAAAGPDTIVHCNAKRCCEQQPYAVQQPGRACDRLAVPQSPGAGAGGLAAMAPYIWRQFLFQHGAAQWRHALHRFWHAVASRYQHNRGKFTRCISDRLFQRACWLCSASGSA
jgi:hypothetical protein